MTVTGFSHVNVNCVDIEKSLPFYADVLGVPITKQFPERVDTGVLLGLAPPHTNMVATLAPGRKRPGIELIEWRLPDTPHSECAAEDNGIAGIVTLLFTSTDPSAVRTRAQAAGLQTRDSGSAVEVQGPEGWVRVTEGPDAALVGAVVNVVDLDESVRCYTESLGLPVDGRDGDSATIVAPTPTEPFAITLRQHGGAQHPALPRRADTPGFLRLAFFDDDVDATYGRAVKAGVRGITPANYFDFGSLRAHAALWFDKDEVLVEVLNFVKTQQ